MAKRISDLPLGSRVKFGSYSVESETAQPIVWLIAAKNHESTPAYPTDSVTLLTENAIDARAFDAKEANNTVGYRSSRGCERYSLSNIDSWLNSSKSGSWYSARHSADASPTSSNVSYGTTYSNKPGFLWYFTSEERAALLDTTLSVAIPTVDGGGSETIVRKMYLLSRSELGDTSPEAEEGTALAIFKNSIPSDRLCGFTEQARDNTNCTETLYAVAPYWTRSAYLSDGTTTATGIAWSTATTGSFGTHYCNYGDYGVRPACNVTSSLWVSDSEDDEGCYAVIFNDAPSAPASITVDPYLSYQYPFSVSWGSSTDPEGGTVTYELERAYDGGTEFSLVYSGAELSHTEDLNIYPHEASTVQYRVRARDDVGNYSDYVYSGRMSIVDVVGPYFSSTMVPGEITESFDITFSVVCDTNKGLSTVDAKVFVDEVSIYSGKILCSGASLVINVSQEIYQRLSNGYHDVKFWARDAYGTVVEYTVLTYKNVTGFTISNTDIMGSTTMPTRIAMSVSRNIPAGATFKVEVCNNAYDTSPAWEDITQYVISGLVYDFQNTTSDAASWGVQVRVTVERNDATGACYISAIGGTFE